MKFLLLCVVAVACVQLAQAQTKTVYKMAAKTVTFLEADKMCRRWGGLLADMTDNNMATIQNYLATSPEILPQDKKLDYWIGRDDTAVEGEWRNAKGGLASKTSWCKGQPDNWANNEHCAQYQGAQDCINDVPCSWNRYFICAFQR